MHFKAIKYIQNSQKNDQTNTEKFEKMTFLVTKPYYNMRLEKISISINIIVDQYKIIKQFIQKIQLLINK